MRVLSLIFVVIISKMKKIYTNIHELNSKIIFSIQKEDIHLTKCN